MGQSGRCPSPPFLRSARALEAPEILPELTRVVLSFEAHLCPPFRPLLRGPACATTVQMDPRWSSVPLPRSWPDHVKSAFLHALGMAHRAMTHIRGRCTDGPAAEVSAADSERLRSEIELLREELRIKDARMARIPARHRPHYSPADRLAILQLKASHGWNEQQAAAAFLISAATIASWLKRVDEQGTDALVQPPVSGKLSPRLNG